MKSPGIPRKTVRKPKAPKYWCFYKGKNSSVEDRSCIPDSLYNEFQDKKGWNVYDTSDSKHGGKINRKNSKWFDEGFPSLRKCSDTCQAIPYYDETVENKIRMKVARSIDLDENEEVILMAILLRLGKPAELNMTGEKLRDYARNIFKEVGSLSAPVDITIPKTETKELTFKDKELYISKYMEKSYLQSQRTECHTESKYNALLLSASDNISVDVDLPDGHIKVSKLLHRKFLKHPEFFAGVMKLNLEDKYSYGIITDPIDEFMYIEPVIVKPDSPPPSSSVPRFKRGNFSRVAADKSAPKKPPPPPPLPKPKMIIGYKMWTDLGQPVTLDPFNMIASPVKVSICPNHMIGIPSLIELTGFYQDEKQVALLEEGDAEKALTDHPFLTLGQKLVITSDRLSKKYPKSSGVEYYITRITDSKNRKIELAKIPADTVLEVKVSFNYMPTRL